MLDLISSFKLLDKLPIAKYKVIETQKDLTKISFPYFMKASIPSHKTEENAVVKCSSFEQAKENYLELRQRFHSKVIIQEEVEGTEMILGLKEDRVFGRLLMMGFGGINAEVLKDISFRALPVDRFEITKMLRELRLFPSLVTRKKFALDKFINITEQISKLNFKEMDLNPIILNENNASIVDARITP